MEKAKVKRGGNIFGEVDLLHGPIFTSMLLFMMPLLISRIFQQLYNMVDTMIVGPSYVILGVLNQSRYALQGLGEKMLPLISSVIELVGKILFVWILIPKYQYTAVIWCEPVIWCVMAVQLVYSLYRNPLMRGK